MFIFSKNKVALTFIFIFFLSTFVKADPIQITSGIVSRGGISLIGSNTNISISTDYWISIAPERWAYSPGSSAKPVIDGFGRLNNSYSYEFRTRGSDAILNNISYRDAFFGGTFMDTNLSYMTLTPLKFVAMPDAPILGQGYSFTVTLPFTMEGYLSGRFYPNGRSSYGSYTELIPPTYIYGSGTATHNYFYDTVQSKWSLYDYQYTFSTQPTPEPTPNLQL